MPPILRPETPPARLVWLAVGWNSDNNLSGRQEQSNLLVRATQSAWLFSEATTDEGLTPISSPGLLQHASNMGAICSFCQLSAGSFPLTVGDGQWGTGPSFRDA